jgi:large subunit ribosomal protein L4
MTGKQVGEIDLNDSVFGIEPNKSVMHDMVKHHLAARRQGTQSTLTRAEVAGGGRKPWRQKGTGRARQGSTRNPHWTHGGIAFGPKPRSFRYDINKKVRRLAMKSALSAKAQAGEILVIDALRLDEIKTKRFKAFLAALKVETKALVVTAEPQENIIKSARNLPGVKTAIAGTINVYDILAHGRLLIEKDAVTVLEGVYAE